MAKGSTDLLAKVGGWAFIIGAVVALVVGFFKPTDLITTVLIALGLVVGFLNVTGRETTPFLLAAVSLVIVSQFGGDAVSGTIGDVIKGVLASLMTFVVPATIIVALKAIYALAHDE